MVSQQQIDAALARGFTPAQIARTTAKAGISAAGTSLAGVAERNVSATNP